MATPDGHRHKLALGLFTVVVIGHIAEHVAQAIQVLVRRVEVHLFYNTIVVSPMAVAVLLHRRPNHAERAQAIYNCAAAPVPA